jgi:hypothetical protein
MSEWMQADAYLTEGDTLADRRRVLERVYIGPVDDTEAKSPKQDTDFTSLGPFEEGALTGQQPRCVIQGGGIRRWCIRFSAL